MMKSKLHWTTEISEKGLLAVIGGLTMIAAGLDIYQMVVGQYEDRTGGPFSIIHICRDSRYGRCVLYK